MWAVVITAFVDNDVQKSFPAEQGVVAVRAIVFGFRCFLRTVIDLKDGCADFAT